MDLNAIKDAAIEALTKVVDYLKNLLENFIADKLG